MIPKVIVTINLVNGLAEMKPAQLYFYIQFEISVGVIYNEMKMTTQTTDITDHQLLTSPVQNNSCIITLSSHNRFVDQVILFEVEKMRLRVAK